ncbi:MAG: RHS repeat-associated core domain-containing protein [Chitinophagales bacterium]|nr:RHS repeat-associated core domain-containing protein [Chitinophagales bacterium]
MAKTPQYNTSKYDHPFGMLMPGRSYSSTAYKYGFNGKEKDDEVSGTGCTYDYGFRIYDSRLARFKSVDPLTKSYPWYTPYQFAGNMPIGAIDLDGLEEKVVIMSYDIHNNVSKIKVNSFRDVESGNLINQELKDKSGNLVAGGDKYLIIHQGSDGKTFKEEHTNTPDVLIHKVEDSKFSVKDKVYPSVDITNGNYSGKSVNTSTTVLSNEANVTSVLEQELNAKEPLNSPENNKALNVSSNVIKNQDGYSISNSGRAGEIETALDKKGVSSSNHTNLSVNTNSTSKNEKVTPIKLSKTK